MFFHRAWPPSTWASMVGLNLHLQKETTEAHTLDNMTNNLCSVLKLVQVGYIPIFERDELAIYDAHNTKI